jgi:hypothetical protein
MAELGYLIDSPVNVYSTEAEVRAWIAELDKFPQSDLAVKSEQKAAKNLLALLEKS